MKRQLILIIAVCLFAGTALAQQLTYKLGRPGIIRVSGTDYFTFEIQVKADVAGTYLWASSMILPFDNTALSTAVTDWVVTKVALTGDNTQSNSRYTVVKTITGAFPNYVCNIGLVGDNSVKPNGPNAGDFVEVSTSYQTWVRVRAKITNTAGVAGMYYNMALMNGQSSYISAANTITNYTNPNLYEGADFTDIYTGRIYSSAGWSQTGNSVDAQWVDWTTAVNTSVWEGMAVVPGGAESQVLNLRIHDSSTLVVPATGQLTLTGTAVNNGTLTIQSNASSEGSFIDNGTLSGTGTYNVERWVKTNGTGGFLWEYVSSPLNDAYALSDLFTTTLPNPHALWYAHEPTNAYVGISDGSPQPMTVMKGYARKYVASEVAGGGGGDAAVTFTGTGSGVLNTGDQSIGVTLTAGAPGGQHGWNLVGNPYPSAINWDLVTLSNPDVEGSYYVRSNGNYGSYSSGLGTVSTSSIIPPMQAFWVRSTVASGTFYCTNNMRLHNAQNIYKTSTYDNTLHLTVGNQGNGLSDDTYIRFKADATEGFDAQFDTYKMFAADSTYPQIYTNNGVDDIAINNLSELLSGRIVPLGFKTNAGGQFTLTADMVSTFTVNGNTVYLEDTVTGVYQDLSINNSYTFSSGVTSGLNRFFLHFSPVTTVVAGEGQNNVHIFGYHNEVHIESLHLLTGDLVVYNTLGQTVVSKHLSGVNTEVISLDPATAAYIVKYNGNGHIITGKIFIHQ